MHSLRHTGSTKKLVSTTTGAWVETEAVSTTPAISREAIGALITVHGMRRSYHAPFLCVVLLVFEHNRLASFSTDGAGGLKSYVGDQPNQGMNAHTKGCHCWWDRKVSLASCCVYLASFNAWFASRLRRKAVYPSDTCFKDLLPLCVIWRWRTLANPSREGNADAV